MQGEPIYRKASPEDLPRIAEFRKSLFEDNPTRSYGVEYYRWKCFQNPVKTGEIWVAEAGGVVVGMKSMVPKRIKVSDKVVTGAETGDTFTHPEYQRRGIFTGLFRAAREGGMDAGLAFIYGTPNDMSLPGYEKRLDYAQVPVELHSRVKTLKSKQPLKAQLHSGFLASLLSPLIDVVSQVIFSAGMRGGAKSDIRITAEATFPDDIDSLWQRASRNYDVALVRTRDYLVWRYVTNPDAYSILIARSGLGEVLGYLVTKTGSVDGVPKGFICDFFTVEDDAGVFKKLVAAALEEFRHKQISLISAWAVTGSFYDKLLWRLGFLPRGRISFICYRNDIGKQILSGHYRWHFTMGDSDNI